ncbi:mannosyl-3-phosphoglycerate phosphatase-related protein [Erwinia tasmaniensis]|uniref:Mannosyl-3-phosphoglycerate phosphatase n=1 Tax=Erwinia tasmaniensis (strain DSM 17950 / CFBP 7177 / CIP 109463 / NCPPB 4357 / Et1/99) TaxID=465817 RepID=B2VDN0_ERWT9|nr:mannosyl-3-phosphoglycerate phosphatase-related protein [Erwinia tasmaniensis]CAO97050.1 Putative mannosyl-3-phosphoglycerate phosphatase [Erwinia tasmaniensis Et1/99]
MPTLQAPLIIVTDLDGSLLDHHTYSWQPAAEWLQRLQEHQVPLVICSSKTAAEIAPLQQALGIGHQPFIAENGAVIQWQNPDASTAIKALGNIDYGTLCHRLLHLKRQFGFKFIGFSDASPQQVADWTGLTTQNAALAKLREASESLIWRDTTENFELFRQQLEEQGLTLVQGGRFWHVMRKGSGKAEALDDLLQHYVQGDRPVTIGLGDGPNDAAMLDAVDYAVVIKGYSKNPVILQRQDKHHIYHTTHYGPEGWRDGLDHFITR